jgi:DNA-binding CsgD family transcriptional regulator
MFTTPLFLHFLLTDPHAKLKNIFFGGVALWIAAQRPIVMYVIKSQTFRQIDTHIAHTFFTLVFLYTVVLGLYASGKVQDQPRKSLARTFSFLLAGFLPAIMIDEVIENMYIPNYPPVFFPLCYAIFSIIFARHFIKLYGHHPQISTLPEASSEQVSVEELFQNYNISPREQEVIRLILQGYSNQQIGDTLFISLSTVKKHVTNIYQKLEIKSRYELITLFKDILSD